MLVGEPKFHSWGRCTIVLTNMHSDLRFNPSSGLGINLYCIIGASLSEPHTSMTSLHTCVYVCLLAWTDHLPKILNERVF